MQDAGDEQARLRVVKLIAYRQGTIIAVKAVARLPVQGDDMDARRTQDDLDQKWRKLTAEGWDVTIASLSGA